MTNSQTTILPDWIVYLIANIGGRYVIRDGKDAFQALGGQPMTLDDLRHAVALANGLSPAKAARQATKRRSGPVYSNNGMEYSSATEAARAIFVSPSTMANHLNNPGKYPTCAGLVFKRVKP